VPTPDNRAGYYTSRATETVSTSMRSRAQSDSQGEGNDMSLWSEHAARGMNTQGDTRTRGLLIKNVVPAAHDVGRHEHAEGAFT
jgi:archaellum component FlaG (FlaF/FlaG flagellin family)